MQTLKPKEFFLEQVKNKKAAWFDKGYNSDNEFFDGEYETGFFVNQRTGEKLTSDEYYATNMTQEQESEILYLESEDEKLHDLVKIVEERNDGDGNAAYMTFYFIPYDLYISLRGTYSSWGSTDYSEVFVSKPYEYKEIRYEKL